MARDTMVSGGAWLWKGSDGEVRWSMVVADAVARTGLAVEGILEGQL